MFFNYSYINIYAILLRVSTLYVIRYLTLYVIILRVCDTIRGTVCDTVCDTVCKHCCMCCYYVCCCYGGPLDDFDNHCSFPNAAFLSSSHSQ